MPHQDGIDQDGVDPDTRTMSLLADVIEADLYRRMTGLSRHEPQADVRELAQKRAFDLLEACRQSGMTLTLTPDGGRA